jgi:hypothetical protein
MENSNTFLMSRMRQLCIITAAGTYSDYIYEMTGLNQSRTADGFADLVISRM